MPKTTRACLLVLLLLGLFSTVGCSDVESCLEGETPGCLNSAVRADGSCLYDLMPVNGICLKSATSNNNSPCGSCAPGAICDTKTARCINFCEQPTVPPGGGQVPMKYFCEAVATSTMPNPVMLDFNAVCRNRCQLNCQRLAQFCPGYTCPVGTCDGADVLTKCATDCPPPAAGGNDTACITRKCNDTRFVLCDSALKCPNNVTPACSTITCTNSCMFDGVDVTGDGVCDDGDVSNSSTAQCNWGSDCVDCGPRTGSELKATYGGLCLYTLNCSGGTGSPDTAGAWCVAQASLSDTARCMPDCSRGQQCPEGFECRQALFANEDGTNSQIEVGGFKSSACLPSACM